MKRFLLACLGMLLLGTAGLLILHQVFDAPPAATAQVRPPSPPPSGAAWACATWRSCHSSTQLNGSWNGAHSSGIAIAW